MERSANVVVVLFLLVFCLLSWGLGVRCRWWVVVVVVVVGGGGAGCLSGVSPLSFVLVCQSYFRAAFLLLSLLCECPRCIL